MIIAKALLAGLPTTAIGLDTMISEGKCGLFVQRKKPTVALIVTTLSTVHVHLQHFLKLNFSTFRT